MCLNHIAFFNNRNTNKKEEKLCQNICLKFFHINNISKILKLIAFTCCKIVNYVESIEEMCVWLFLIMYINSTSENIISAEMQTNPNPVLNPNSKP